MSAAATGTRAGRAGGAQPLRPEPEDEGLHEAGPEPLWNESWYVDAISADGSLGVYHRIGRMPNQNVCLVSTCVVRPGEPALLLVEQAPLPAPDDEAQAVSTDRVSASYDCRRPLADFRISVEGVAESHSDHAAPLRGERGERTPIALELAWESAGVPYRWRHSSRYEIPCRVRGSVRVGEETIALEGPGQRDHSWGARDWWASDWVWSALHLDDGTHVHHVSVPGHPRFAVGYLQRDGELTELERARCESRIAADGLISGASLALEPGALELELEPLAFGAVRLTSEQGHVSHFPRAMCRISSGDGRTGLGWVEWNRNQGQHDKETQ